MGALTDKTDDGGPAYPLGVATATGENPVCSANFENGEGMTLLDWFAGQALCGLCTRAPQGYTTDMRASDAYLIAQAMIAEKRRREGEQ